MEGRWTLYQARASGPWTDEPVPVVPCDDAAIDRAVEAAIDFDADNADPNRGWYLQLAREMFRAAGKAS